MPKILVIEDETIIREEIMTWLEVKGYDVVGAENGKRGLEICYRDQPDLILCDVHMPELDGHGVLIELRSRRDFAQVPFIFLTANTDRDNMRKSMSLGADDYITKPFTHKEIIQAVKARMKKQEQFQSQVEQLSNLLNQERDLRMLKLRLIGMFSHDFRNPLATILSSSQMLQNYSNRFSEEQKQQKLRKIDGSVHLLLQMLDEMLMVAEVENGQLTHNPQPGNLKKLINKILENFELIDGGKHKIVSSVDLPDGIIFDANLVQHIVTNLVSNALKYSPEGSEVNVNAYLDSEHVQIIVQDSGIGIPETDIHRIFEPFFRSKNTHSVKGTGLGLTLLKEAVDTIGAIVDVESKENEGTVFTVSISLEHV